MIINDTMWFYSVDYAVMLYKGGHKMEYLICLITVNVIELKVDLLHCISLSRLLSTLFSCI